MAQIHNLMGLMDDARRRMDCICEEFLGMASKPERGAWRPATDVYECEDQIVVKMEVAGLRPGDAEITVERNVLTVRGERNDRCPLKKKLFHRMEIRYGRFEVQVQINVAFDVEAMKAEIRDGFLTVVVPKADPPRPQKVDVEIKV